MSSPIVAAIDIGTNSTKLLVAGPGVRHFEVADTRLGEGLAASARLAPSAVQRTLDALVRFRTTAESLGAARLAAVATSASRDAVDGSSFLDAAERVLGTRPVLLSGADEGRLAALAATVDVAPTGHRRLLLDIGGGSTEFVLLGNGAPSVCSIDVGCVRLTEAELTSDPPRPEQLSNAIGRVQDHLDDVLRELPALEDISGVIGIGGTITTVAAVELGVMDLERIHGLELSRAAVEDVFRTLATESLADRVHNPGLPSGRAPVIVGGLCVLVAVLRRLRADSLTVSTRTLVDGVCQHLSTGASWPPTEQPTEQPTGGGA